MTRIPASEASCPYCGVKLTKHPTRKRYCPSCKRVIYVKLGLDNINYAVTEDELKNIRRERRLSKVNDSQQKRETVKWKYPISIVGLLGFLVIIALLGVTGGSLVFVSFIVGLPAFIILLIWAGMVRKAGSAPGITMCILLTILFISVITGVVPYFNLIHSRDSSPTTYEPERGSALEEYMNPLITGADWVKMTHSQKSNWVKAALDAMVTGGELSRSEVKSTSYYVSRLDEVFNNPNSQKSLVAWELTKFTSQ